MIHYLTARMRPELKTLTHANYARIYAQLDRLDHSPFHALATALAALRGFIDIDDKPFQQGLRRAEGQARSSAARMNRSLGKIDRGFGRMIEPDTEPRRCPQWVISGHPALHSITSALGG